MKETEVEYKAGDVIFSEGEAGVAVFQIIRGTIELYKNEALLTECRTNDFIGEIEVMDNSIRIMTAIAKTSAVLKRMTRNEFINLLKKDGDISVSVIKGISRKIKIIDSLKSKNTGKTSIASSIFNTFKGFSSSKALVPVENKQPDTTVKNTSPAKKPSLFRILFKAGEEDDALANSPLIILPSIAGDYENTYQKYIADILREIHGIKVKTYNQPMKETDPAKAFLIAQNWLTEKNANLAIWVERETNADAVNLYFAGRNSGHDAPGMFTYHSYLRLPSKIDGEYKALLKLIAIAAMPYLSYEQGKLLKALLPRSLEEVAEPTDAKSNLLCYANALATAGTFDTKSNFFKQAEEVYNKFISQTDAKEKIYAAMAMYQKGLINQAKGEILNDIETLHKSATNFDDAILLIDKDSFPSEWALFYLKLGVVLHKIAVLEEKYEIFEQAMSAYRNALKVYSSSFEPLRYAETLNNLGLTTHLLAEHLQSEDLTKRAVKIYKSALNIRTKEQTPLLWAATENNMASVLFLLGRMTKDAENYIEAINGFKDALSVYNEAGLYRMSMITTKNLKRAEEELIKLGGTPGLAESNQIPVPDFLKQGL